MQVDRYKIHDIDIVVDRLQVSNNDTKRLQTSIQMALKLAKGIIRIADKEGKLYYFSKYLMDPVSGYHTMNRNPIRFRSIRHMAHVSAAMVWAIFLRSMKHQ